MPVGCFSMQDLLFAQQDLAAAHLRVLRAAAAATEKSSDHGHGEDNLAVAESLALQAENGRLRNMLLQMSGNQYAGFSIGLHCQGELGHSKGVNDVVQSRQVRVPRDPPDNSEHSDTSTKVLRPDNCNGEHTTQSGSTYVEGVVPQ